MSVPPRTPRNPCSISAMGRYQGRCPGRRGDRIEFPSPNHGPGRRACQPPGLACPGCKLLDDQPEPGLRFRSHSGELNPQDPPARINLCPACSTTVRQRGARASIWFAGPAMAPELSADLQPAIADGWWRPQAGWRSAGEGEGTGCRAEPVEGWEAKTP